MLSKISIGTANFTQKYGVLSSDNAIDVDAILKLATDNKIDTFDTAFAYGDFLNFLPKTSTQENLKIITKFSVLEDYNEIFSKIEYAKNQYNFGVYSALLVHDPQNLQKIDKKQLIGFFDKLRKFDLVKKIGVSVYDLNDLKNFRNIIDPELIQIPLNPLNQIFVNDKFVNYVEQHGIEVHARSLFLQGVLLSGKLPESLSELEPLWCLYMEATKSYSSRLNALLSWAFTHQWISKWILGISCKQDLIDIIEHKKQALYPYFSELKNMTNRMTDPRNWKMA